MKLLVDNMEKIVRTIKSLRRDDNSFERSARYVEIIHDTIMSCISKSMRIEDEELMKHLTQLLLRFALKMHNYRYFFDVIDWDYFRKEIKSYTKK